MEASMSVAEYDLIVIGGGPAGEKGAAQAAYFGKRVALVERSPTLGGAVANASIPFKALRETALFLAGYRTRNLHGIDFHLKERATLRDFLAQEHALVRDYRFKVATNLDHPQPRLRPRHGHGHPGGSRQRDRAGGCRRLHRRHRERIVPDLVRRGRRGRGAV
jgi:pyruvate/2-oxoglutarate dehydrogenase complex dihydrolipoamide dehydrogenase (E3) component